MNRMELIKKLGKAASLVPHKKWAQGRAARSIEAAGKTIAAVGGYTDSMRDPDELEQEQLALAKFIALADPQNILDLIREIQVTQKALVNAIADGTKQGAEMDNILGYIEVAEDEMSNTSR